MVHINTSFHKGNINLPHTSQISFHPEDFVYSLMSWALQMYSVGQCICLCEQASAWDLKWNMQRTENAIHLPSDDNSVISQFSLHYTTPLHICVNITAPAIWQFIWVTSGIGQGRCAVWFEGITIVCLQPMLRSHVFSFGWLPFVKC